MKKDFFWFLRPTLVVLVCYGVAVGVSYLLSQRSVDQLDAKLSELTTVTEKVRDIAKPSTGLTPKQVVEIQSDALRDPDQTRGTLQCMSFASPNNLELTGPLEKFARIVRAGKFAVLSNPDALLVGDSTFAGDHARVLVTAIKRGKVSGFVWVLSKQAETPYEGCWMTDGVFPLMPETEESGEI